MKHCKRCVTSLRSFEVGISPIATGTQSEYTPGGGPGGLPVEPDSDIPSQIDFQNFPTWLNNGDGTAIAILDTVNSNQLERDKAEYERTYGTAINIWVNQDGTFQNHGGYKIGETNAEIKHYPYPMVDHGLFVSGIAHRVSQQSKINLYQALDDFGVGSAESIVAAFHRLAWDIIQPDFHANWVINMSMVFLYTGREPPIFKDLETYLDGQLRSKIRNFLSTSGGIQIADTLDDVMRLLVCFLLALKSCDKQILIVGSAGNLPIDEQMKNNTFTNGGLSFAMAPASYPEVVAVAASEAVSANSLATYSLPAQDNPNFAGAAPINNRQFGVVTFGGALAPGG